MKAEFTFHGQRPGEKVLMVVKNHPFLLFWPGLKAIFWAGLGVSTFVYINSPYAGLAMVILILISLSGFARSYYTYSQSVFLITNQRIMNVTQEGFVKRKIIEAEIDRITAVASDTSGLFKMLLKYGDMSIRVSGGGSEQALQIKNIPTPYEVQQKIASIRKL